MKSSRKKKLKTKSIILVFSFKGKWNGVLLGRKTWESLDSSQQPLPGRLNIVISKSLK